jgi:hypothetical protein
MIDAQILGDENEVVDLSSGTGRTIYWQEESKLVLSNPPGEDTAVTLGDTVVITANHAFTGDEAEGVPVDGWKTAQIDEEQAEALFDDEGGVNVNALKGNLKVFFSGDSPTVGAWLAKKKRIIMIIPPLDCAAGRKVQLGTKCSPARIKKYTFSMGKHGGGATEGKGYMVEISAVQAKMLFYTGTTPLQTDPS